MKYLLMALCALVLSAFGAGTASAAESHIYTDNKSDAFAWITVYPGASHSGALGAWCVPPGKYDQHGLTTYVTDVQVEISHKGCQHNPVILKTTALTHLSRGGYLKNEFTVRGAGGRYFFTRTKVNM
jgi:hypothetical protein